jgi:hypothetical protein
MPAQTFSAQPPAATQWYWNHLIPKHQLVLLDGDDKVGKTLLTASIGALLASLPEMRSPGSILYANIKDQQRILAEQLLWQKPDSLDPFRHIDLDELPRHPKSNILVELIPFLQRYLKEFSTRLLFLDGLDQFLKDHLADQETQPTPIDYEVFWRALRELSEVSKCTIFVTRRDGLHQSRSYGPFTRLGSQIAPIVLTMMWHPTDPAQRIITLKQNQRGPTNQQFHLAISPAGYVVIGEVENHHVLKPARSPAPWTPDPYWSDPLTAVYEFIEKFLADGPFPEKSMEYGVTKGFNARKYAQAMARLKVPFVYKNGDCYLLPTEAMRERSQMKDDQTQAAEKKTPEIQPNPARTEQLAPDSSTRGSPPVTNTQSLSLTGKPASPLTKSKAS